MGACPTITAAAGMAGNNEPILFDGQVDTRYSGAGESGTDHYFCTGDGRTTIRRLLFMENPTTSPEMSSNRQDKNGGNVWLYPTFSDSEQLYHQLTNYTVYHLHRLDKLIHTDTSVDRYIYHE